MSDFGIFSVKVVEFRFGIATNEFLSTTTTGLTNIEFARVFQMRFARIGCTIHLFGLHHLRDRREMRRKIWKTLQSEGRWSSDVPKIRRLERAPASTLTITIDPK